METPQYRLDGSVSREITDLCVKLFWVKDVKKARRKSFKEELLTEFSGRLIIDFRRNGSDIVMNDVGVT